MATYTGGCHCGAISFSVEAEFTEGMSCNCSICRRRGHILAFTPRAALKARVAEGALKTYRFNKKIIQHHFCGTCGCAPFGEGATPDGAEMAAVNLRCVDGLDLKAIRIMEVDGASF